MPWSSLPPEGTPVTHLSKHASKALCEAPDTSRAQEDHEHRGCVSPGNSPQRSSAGPKPPQRLLALADCSPGRSSCPPASEQSGGPAISEQRSAGLTTVRSGRTNQAATPRFHCTTHLSRSLLHVLVAGSVHDSAMCAHDAERAASRSCRAISAQGAANAKAPRRLSSHSRRAPSPRGS